MLPVISEDIANTAFSEIFEDMPAWRKKKMIHYIKEENPEINTAIIEAANKSSLDPKAVALGAYMTYLLIELAAKRKRCNYEFYRLEEGINYDYRRFIKRISRQRRFRLTHIKRITAGWTY